MSPTNNAVTIPSTCSSDVVQGQNAAVNTCTACTLVSTTSITDAISQTATSVMPNFGAMFTQQEAPMNQGLRMVYPTTDCHIQFLPWSTRCTSLQQPYKLGQPPTFV